MNTNLPGTERYNFNNILKTLHENKFFCKIPRIYIYTEAEKELFGIGVDEVNNETDKTSLMELVDSYKSVYEIAYIVYENNDIYIKDDDDILKILKIATEALDLLDHSPNVELVKNYEDLKFALETLVEKIKSTNGDYLTTLYNKNDKIQQYNNDVFGTFQKIKSMTGVRPDVTELKKTKHRSIDGIDFNNISL